MGKVIIDGTELRTLSHAERVKLESRSDARSTAKGARGKHQNGGVIRNGVRDPRGKSVTRIKAPTDALRDYVPDSEAVLQLKLGKNCEVRVIQLAHANSDGRRELNRFADKANREADSIILHIAPCESLGSEAVRTGKYVTQSERIFTFYASGTVDALDALTRADSSQGGLIVSEWRYPVNVSAPRGAAGSGEFSVSSKRRTLEGKREAIARAEDRQLSPTVNAIGTVPGKGLQSGVMVRARTFHPNEAQLNALAAQLDYNPEAISQAYRSQFYELLQYVVSVNANGKPTEAVVDRYNLAIRELSAKYKFTLPERKGGSVPFVRDTIAEVLAEWLAYAGSQGEAKRREQNRRIERELAAWEEWKNGKRNWFPRDYVEPEELDYYGFPVQNESVVLDNNKPIMGRSAQSRMIF